MRLAPKRGIWSIALAASLAGFALAQSSGSIPLVDPKTAGKAAPPNQTATPSAGKPVATDGSVLPQSFAGWQRASDVRSPDPRQADDVNAPALKEYGFSGIEIATYTRNNVKLDVKASRFADAGGAFGAFTFYRDPGTERDKIGDAAASAGSDAVFYTGNVFVQAHSEQGNAPSPADMRELAQQIPLPTGAARNLPSLPSYVPQRGIVTGSSRYIVGPVASAIKKLPLTPADVRFDLGAEIMWSQATAHSGTGDLVLISYPTPQIAAERLHALEASIAKTPADGTTRLARRSGPVVVWLSGALSMADATAIAASVDYNAKVTWDEPTGLAKRDNVGNLVIAALALSGIILLISLVAGIVFGGIRLYTKRFYPDRFFDRNIEVISLHLSDEPRRTID